MPKIKQQKDRKTDRAREFFILLYPDNPEHQLAATDILLNYNAVGILHDKDIDDNGNLKKPHWHIIVKFPNPRFLIGVANLFSIDERFVQFLDDFKRAGEYLLHFNQPRKYHYDKDELRGQLKEAVIELLQKGYTETFQVKEIFDYIRKGKDYITFDELFDWCLDNGYWSTYRRNATSIKDVLYAHNYKYNERS